MTVPFQIWIIIGVS